VSILLLINPNSLSNGKKKSAAETLQQAKERASEKDTEIINGDPVHRKLQPAVAKKYQKQVDLWLA
jgi:hypothetical protein